MDIPPSSQTRDTIPPTTVAHGIVVWCAQQAVAHAATDAISQKAFIGCPNNQRLWQGPLSSSKG